MFTKIVLFVVFATLVVAEESVVPIIEQKSHINPNGGFNWNYETGDGSKASQTGELRNIGEMSANVMQGSFSYQGDDGKTYSISYVADENGYQPVGDHLPVAPEIPPAIQKALDFLATAQPPKETK